MLKADDSRPSISEPNQKLLFCPLAEIIKPEMKTRGSYPKGYPEGAVIHFTGGASTESSLSYGREQGFCFFMIDKAGRILQSFPLNRWGFHAGPSSWKGLSGVSKHFVGIELDCGGKLQQRADGEFITWFGRVVPEDKRRMVTTQDNRKGGYYEKFTQAQEDSLLMLLKWLKRNNPGVFKFANVVGHDEISPGRKIDPGGSLSMTMPELRKALMIAGDE